MSRRLACGLRVALLGALALLATVPGDGFAQPAQPGGIALQPSPHAPLASVFVGGGGDGGAYYVTEAGRHVDWSAEHPGRLRAHVSTGKWSPGVR